MTESERAKQIEISLYLIQISFTYNTQKCTHIDIIRHNVKYFGQIFITIFR